jgi:thioredoxin reductase (NADPH)
MFLEFLGLRFLTGSWDRACFIVMLGISLASIVMLWTNVHSGGPTIDLKAALTKDNVVDILIIGSGPAGLLAAVYGGRAHHDTWVLEGNEPGGLLTKTTIVENWPGEVSIMGGDVIKKLKAQAKRHGAQFLADTAANIDFSAYPYIVHTDTGRVIHALSIIIATGATPKKLSIPGEDDFWGYGVSNCAVCDGANFEGLDVMVVGGGDSAVEEALQLAPIAASITIMVRGSSMRAASSMKARLSGYSNINVRYNVTLVAVEGKKEENHTMVTHVVVRNTETGVEERESISGVFLAIGHIPNTWVFKDQITLSSLGYIALSDRTQKTSIPGVFAAGDVADPIYRQAGVASGDGIKAALDADEFLRESGYNEVIAHQLKDHRLIAYQEVHAISLQHLGSIDDFDAQVKNQEGLVLVDFYAEYCPSCMHMLPIIESLVPLYSGHIRFFKVDKETAGALAAHLHVMKVPTLMAFKDGALVARNHSIMSRTELQDFIDHIISDS